MAPAQILSILHRQFQPDGHPVPGARVLAAMGLTSACQLTARKALGLLGVRPGSADAAGYLEDARSPAPAIPPRTGPFTTAVYSRGAMTLQALRLRVGDPVFFRILRTYAAEYRFGNATNADFITDAEKTAARTCTPSSPPGSTPRPHRQCLRSCLPSEPGGDKATRAANLSTRLGSPSS